MDVLKGPGPFTVFAPTDEAFAKLPKETLDAVLADKEKLTSILTYHVVPGKVAAADVIKVTEAKTAQGSSVRVSLSEGAVKIDNAKVISADVAASNGIIHVIGASGCGKTGGQIDDRSQQQSQDTTLNVHPHAHQTPS